MHRIYVAQTYLKQFKTDFIVRRIDGNGFGALKINSCIEETIISQTRRARCRT